MSDFYVNCIVKDDFILLTHFHKGKRHFLSHRYRPHLFERDHGEDYPEYKDIFGGPLRRVDFRSMGHARSKIYKEKERGHIYYGNTNFQYAYIADHYPGNIEYDFNLLTVVYIDIEVASESGFPHAEEATEEITAITMKVVGPNREDKKNVIVFGNNKFKTDRDDVEYRRFKSEKDLITSFIDEWEAIGPDIVTGWYIEYFDIPYLVNRIVNLFGNFGEDEEEGLKMARRLSVWDMIQERNALTPLKHGQKVYDLLGVSILDYFSLYRKFSLKGQESYSLNHIAHVELGEGKISYEEYGDLHTLYLKDYQKFMEYNIRDVELVEKLEDKLKFIEMAVSLAYDAKVNFYDVFAQTRMWDSIIYNYLRERKIVIPPRPDTIDENYSYEGAYVKEPKPGLYYWVASFDLDSMYPMIMIEWNISPETLYRKGKLNFDQSKYDSMVQYLLTKPELPDVGNRSICPSGYLFSNKKRGFLPEILIGMYEARVKAKAESIKYKKIVSMISDELKNRGYVEED